MLVRRATLAACCLLGLGCSFDWEAYDPRGQQPSHGGGGSGALGGSGGAVGGMGGIGGAGGAGGGQATGGGGVDGLLASWTFEEGAGTSTSDVTGHGFDGTIQNPDWVAGKYGGGLRFDDSDDIVTVVATSAFDRVPGQSYTITMWLQREMGDFAHSGTVAVFFGPESDDYYGLEPQFDGTEPTFSLWDGGTHVGENVVAMPLGDWAHYAAVVDGGTDVRLYEDAVEVSSGTANDDQQTAARVTIGGYGSTVPFGILDNVRWYTKALTPSEVAADMLQ